MNNEKTFLPLLLFLVGAAATIALVALFAYAPDLRRLESSDSVAVSRSAVGFAGLQSLLRLPASRPKSTRAPRPIRRGPA